MDKVLVQWRYTSITYVDMAPIGEKGKVQVVACTKKNEVHMKFFSIEQSHFKSFDEINARFLLYIVW